MAPKKSGGTHAYFFARATMSGARDEVHEANETRGKGRPSLPDYLPIENLAIAVSAQKASVKPDQTVQELEAETKKLYPEILRELVLVHGWPVVTWKQKNGGKL